MAQPANAHETYDSLDKSIREDLTSIVEMISPTETPYMTAIGRGSAKSTFHEWQTSELTAAADDNVVKEGDAASIAAAIATVRVGNYTQISDKTLAITGTQMAVDHAGINDMKNWQLLNKAKELKRDLDKQMMSNKASVAGAADAATARQSGGYESMVFTNESIASDGTTSSYTAGLWVAPVDGTARALTEDMLQDVLSLAWAEGGEPTKVFCHSFNKRKISGFTGGTTRTDKSEDKKLFASLEYYVGDFGEVQIVPSRQCRTRTVLVVDPTLISLCFLREYDTHELARNGDAESHQLVVEYTQRVNNEKGCGIIRDLTVS